IPAIATVVSFIIEVPSVCRTPCAALRPAAARRIGRASKSTRSGYPALRGVERQENRSPRLPGEVEVAFEVAEDRLVLAYVGPRVGSAVGARVDPLAVQEVVLDELEVGVEA